MKSLLSFLSIIFISMIISCDNSSLLNDENISDFRIFIDKLSQDDNIKTVARNLDNLNLIFANSHTGEDLVVDDYICRFLEHFPRLGCISKTTLNIDFLAGELNNPDIERKSASLLKFEQGIKLLKGRGQKEIELISFQEYNHSILLGNFYEGNAYVYSPDIELDLLTSDELYVLGFRYAVKTKFNAWFYIAPLG